MTPAIAPSLPMLTASTPRSAKTRDPPKVTLRGRRVHIVTRCVRGLAKAFHPPYVMYVKADIARRRLWLCCGVTRASSCPTMPVEMWS
jgi:hypothetical protein